jgi:4-amino-4-deoxy-L-arabinose transferase-like glycosyltransferase
LNVSRLWPVLIITLFCLPLFYGLRTDLNGDEAGHAFSVDFILETGDWLLPKQSPFPDRGFLEKPPLKFWLVAAGIRAGLPHDEFGMRFWDALFGGLAFLYLYGIGRRMGGALCGVGAVLILFVHGPLIFAHGLRSNNMEAALVLSYCGGFYHYFKWASAGDGERRWPHAMAVALYFAFGFMMKFVAALFLPLVLGLASLIVPSYRRRLFSDWRLWMMAGLLALALIAPWFLWAHLRFGRDFWNEIFGTHVYTRFTSYLDPEHLHPWHYYFTELWRALKSANALWLVLVGAPLLAADGIRRRSAEVLVVFMWFAVPFVAISFGSSKLYHYAYAFLPPVGLAGGYVGAFLWDTVKPRVELATEAVGRKTLDRGPLAILTRSRIVRGTFLLLSVLSLFVLVWTFAVGDVVIHVGDDVFFKNHLLLRPGLLAMLFAVLGGWPEAIGKIGIPLLILGALPVPAYRGTLGDLTNGTLLMRDTRDCILRVQAKPELQADGPRGMYLDTDGYDYDTAYSHHYAYYFRTVRPWHRPRQTPPEKVAAYISDPAEQRPVLIETSRYDELITRVRKEAGTRVVLSPAVVEFETGALMALPGPYAVCGPRAPDSSRAW